jgi:hypothetical protein
MSSRILHKKLEKMVFEKKKQVYSKRDKIIKRTVGPLAAKPCK